MPSPTPSAACDCGKIEHGRHHTDCPAYSVQRNRKAIERGTTAPTTPDASTSNRKTIEVTRIHKCPCGKGEMYEWRPHNTDDAMLRCTECGHVKPIPPKKFVEVDEADDERIGPTPLGPDGLHRDILSLIPRELAAEARAQPTNNAACLKCWRGALSAAAELAAQRVGEVERERDELRSQLKVAREALAAAKPEIRTLYAQLSAHGPFSGVKGARMPIDELIQKRPGSSVARALIAIDAALAPTGDKQ